LDSLKKKDQILHVEFIFVTTILPLDCMLFTELFNCLNIPANQIRDVAVGG